MSKSLQFSRSTVACCLRPTVVTKSNNLGLKVDRRFLRSDLRYFFSHSQASSASAISARKCSQIFHQYFSVGHQRHFSETSHRLREKMALSDEDAKKACVAAGPETEGFFFQQTMLRIKEPTRSLDFYTRIMGMTLLLKLDFPEMEFSLYFLGYEKAEDVPSDPKERAKFCFSRKACLELTHNHGSEKKDDQVYHNGNSDPRGFGHIGIVVPDVYKACERFEKLGVNFIKKPDGGKMKGLAFIKDPDDYWIEILNPNNMAN